MTKKTFINLCALIVIITGAGMGCKNISQSNDKDVLKETDRFYSALSVEKGMNASFLAMFDTNGVILRADHLPIVGYTAIKKLLGSGNDSSFVLMWEPDFSKTATSGELGYTYGTYKINAKISDSLLETGTYVTIWQKQSDGNWKALLDTGNPGLGQPD